MTNPWKPAHSTHVLEPQSLRPTKSLEALTVAFEVLVIVCGVLVLVASITLLFGTLNTQVDLLDIRASGFAR